jgi:two-component system nitrogen regulation response regulator GlnG
LAREDVIGAQLIEAQLGQRSEIAPVAELEAAAGGLADAVETHLSRYFAAFGRDLPPDGMYDRILAEIERPLLSLSMAAVRGNQLKAAKMLGINRNTLRKKLTELGINPQIGRR